MLLATRDPKRYSTTIRIGPLERFANGRSALFGSRSVILLSPCLIFQARSSLIQRRATLPESILATIWCSGRARRTPEPSSAVARAHRRIGRRGKVHAANFGSTGDVTIPDRLDRRRSAAASYWFATVFSTSGSLPCPPAVGRHELFLPATIIVARANKAVLQVRIVENVVYLCACFPQLSLANN